MKYFIIIIAFLSFLGCKNRKSEGHHENNEIIIIDKKHLLLKKMDRNGVLVQEQQLLIQNTDTTADGYYRNYYSNGEIREARYYKNGSLNGFITTYYENGNKQTEFYVIDGKRVGRGIDYFPNGNPRNVYFAKTPSSYWLHVAYNENNTIKYFDGELYTLSINKGWQQFKRGDTLKVIVCLPKLDNINPQLQMVGDYNDKRFIDTMVSSFDTVYNFSEFYYTKILQLGNYSFKFKVSLFDSKTNTSIKEGEGRKNFTVSQQ